MWTRIYVHGLLSRDKMFYLAWYDRFVVVKMNTEFSYVTVKLTACIYEDGVYNRKTLCSVNPFFYSHFPII